MRSSVTTEKSGLRSRSAGRVAPGVAAAHPPPVASDPLASVHDALHSTEFLLFRNLVLFFLGVLWISLAYWVYTGRAPADRRPLARWWGRRARPLPAVRRPARLPAVPAGRVPGRRAHPRARVRGARARAAAQRALPALPGARRAGLPRLPGLQRQAEAGLHRAAARPWKLCGRCARGAKRPWTSRRSSRSATRRRIRAPSTSCCARRQRESARPPGVGRPRLSRDLDTRAPARTRPFKARLHPLPHPRVGFNPPPSWSTLPPRSGGRQGESVPIVCQFAHTGPIGTGASGRRQAAWLGEGASGRRGAAAAAWKAGRIAAGAGARGGRPGTGRSERRTPNGSATSTRHDRRTPDVARPRRGTTGGRLT